MSDLVLDLTIYIAPRVGRRERAGRAVRHAECGHDVYLSERGIDAVDVRGKRLVCDLCMGARVGEHGYALGVWTSPL